MEEERTLQKMIFWKIKKVILTDFLSNYNPISWKNQVWLGKIYLSFTMQELCKSNFFLSWY